MAIDQSAITNEVIARMSPEDAKTVLADIVQFLDEQKLLSREQAMRNSGAAKRKGMTASQREQALNRSHVFGGAQGAYDTAYSHVILKARMANAARDRKAILASEAAARLHDEDDES